MRSCLRRDERAKLAVDGRTGAGGNLCTLEGLLEVLVRRAIVAARQRSALARRALAGVGIALRRTAVEADTLGKLLEELGREMEVRLDHAPDEQLVLHGEVRPHLVEERAGRTGEIAPVIGQAANRALAGVQNLLLVPALRRIPSVLDDSRAQLPVHRAAESIHALLDPLWFS